MTDTELFSLFSTVEQLDKREFDIYFHSKGKGEIRVLEDIIENNVWILIDQITTKEPINKKMLETEFGKLFNDTYNHIKNEIALVTIPKGFHLYDQTKFKPVWKRLYWMILGMRHNMIFNQTTLKRIKAVDIVPFDFKKDISFPILFTNYTGYKNCYDTSKSVLLYLKQNAESLKEYKDDTIDVGNFLEDLSKTKFNKISTKNDRKVFDRLLYGDGMLKKCLNKTKSPMCFQLSQEYLDVLNYAKIILWIHAFLYVEDALIVQGVSLPDFVSQIENTINNVQTVDDAHKVVENDWKIIKKDDGSVDEITKMMKKEIEEMNIVLKQQAQWKKTNPTYILYDSMHVLMTETSTNYVTASEMDKSHKNFLNFIKTQYEKASDEMKERVKSFWPSFVVNENVPIGFYGNVPYTKRPQLWGEYYIGVPDEDPEYSRLIAKLLFVFLILLGYEDSRYPNIDGIEAMEVKDLRQYFIIKDSDIVKIIKKPSPSLPEPTQEPTLIIKPSKKIISDTLALPDETPTFNWNNVNNFKTLTLAHYKRGVLGMLNKTDMVNLGFENYKQMKLHKKRVFLEIVVEPGSSIQSVHDLPDQECVNAFKEYVEGIDKKAILEKIVRQVIVPISKKIDNSRNVLENDENTKKIIQNAINSFRLESIKTKAATAQSIKEIMINIIDITYVNDILGEALKKLEIISIDGKPKLEKEDIWWSNDTDSPIGRGRNIYIYNPDRMGLVWANFCVLLRMALYSKTFYEQNVFIEAYKRILDFSDIKAFNPPVVEYSEKIKYELAHLKGVLERIEHISLYHEKDATTYNTKRIDDEIFSVIRHYTNKHWETISKSRGWNKAFKNLNIGSETNIDPSWDKALQTKYLHCLSIIADVLNSLDNMQLVDDDLLARCKAEWPKKKLFKKNKYK